MAGLVEALNQTRPFDESHVEEALRRTAEQRGIKAGLLIHATRVAVTGRTASPGLFEMVALLAGVLWLARLEQLHHARTTRADR